MVKKEMILSLIDQARKFRFCGPSDDPDEQTAVTVGYRDLTTRLKRLAGPILSKGAADRLNAINVEFNDLFSVFDANSELEALFPDIEAALEHYDEHSGPTKGKSMPLPVPVCVIVGEAIGSYVYNHRTLERMFYESGARGEVPEGNCVTKCQTWLKRLHTEVADPAAVLGKLIEEFMEVDGTSEYNHKGPGREKIREALGRYGLSYHTGGLILGAAAALPTKSLHQVLKDRDLTEVDKEFARSLAHVESDPPTAITAACAILESLFKVYIADNSIDLPADQSLKPLWKATSKHLGLDPSAVEDDDIKRILSGMTSIVDGVGALRTHAGSAHGHGKKAYRVQPRHARLAIHAAHTLVGFIVETWTERSRKGAAL